MRTIIYCRKSTDDEKNQQQSLDIQLEWINHFVENNKDVKVIDTIIEAKSAFKIEGRDGFAKLVEYFQNGEADTLIVYQLDRICRNPLDEGNIKWLTQQGKIKKIISSQGEFDGRQILTLSLFLAMANQSSIDHSYRVTKGKEKKVESGEISWRARLGYYNDKNDEGKAKPKDDEQGYIKRIFEMRSEGHSVRLIEEQIYEEGFRTRKGNKIGKTVMERIIKSPFYYGMIEYKGELHKGNHEPLVSKEIWDKANSFGRGILIFHEKPLSPLKGKVTHWETGDRLCCSLIKKKNIYFHVHGRKKDKLWYNQKLIVQHFDENIELYCIPEEHKEKVKKGIYENFNKDIDENKKEKTIIQSRIKKLEGEVVSLRNMRRRDEITAGEFKQDKNQVINDIEDLQNRLIKYTRDYSVILDNLNDMVELFVELKDKRKTMNDEQKLDIINNIVVELKIDNQKRLEVEENHLFKAFRLCNSNIWWTHRATIPGPIA